MKKIRSFFKGVRKEIGRVRWPKKDEMVKYSVSTILFIVFFGGFFYIINWLSILIKWLAR